jgi:hypothetical protein
MYIYLSTLNSDMRKSRLTPWHCVLTVVTLTIDYEYAIIKISMQRPEGPPHPSGAQPLWLDPWKMSMCIHAASLSCAPCDSD